MVALLDRPAKRRFAPLSPTTSPAVSPEISPATRGLHRHEPKQIHARRLDHTLSARRQPRLSLTLHHSSDRGLSATSSIPLSCGEGLSLFITTHPASRLWGTLGHVTRCEPAPDGYRITITFDTRPAA